MREADEKREYVWVMRNKRVKEGIFLRNSNKLLRIAIPRKTHYVTYQTVRGLDNTECSETLDRRIIVLPSLLLRLLKTYHS